MENQFSQWPYHMIMPFNNYMGPYISDHQGNSKNQVHNYQFLPFSPCLVFENLNGIPKHSGALEMNERVSNANEQEKCQQVRKQAERNTKRKVKNDIKLHRKIKKSKQRKKNDPDFKLNQNNGVRKVDQIPDRNQFSNCFRAFLKLLVNKLSSEKYRKQFQKIKSVRGLKLEYHEFQAFLQNKIPVYNNYINQNEFLKLYRGDLQENITFRIMFNLFTKTDGVLHILLMGNKKKIMPKSIMGFLSAIRRVQDEIDSQNKTKQKSSL